jgi:hypothetical protein
LCKNVGGGSSRRWRYYDDIVPTDNDGAQGLNVIWMSDIVGIFQDEVHVLIESLEFTP